MGTKSTPIKMLDTGMNFRATCNLNLELILKINLQNATAEMSLPTARSCAQIDQGSAVSQKVVLLIKLHQLERGTSAVTLFLCQMIPCEDSLRIKK